MFCFLGNKKAAWWGGPFVTVVPEVGIEPTLLAEHEFESCASTSSAIRANGGGKNKAGRIRLLTQSNLSNHKW